MIDIPFRIVDLIMKFAGAYSQDKTKAPYLEDIKLISIPLPNENYVHAWYKFYCFFNENYFEIHDKKSIRKNY